MNTEPKPRMVSISRSQAMLLLGHQDEINVPHVYIDSKANYTVKADEWRAFQAISGVQHE